MKSAYELAMERLQKASPSPSLTDEQKKELALLNHPLIPEDEFLRKMRHVLAVPKAELEQTLEEAKQANADRPKRGRKPKSQEQGGKRGKDASSA